LKTIYILILALCFSIKLSAQTPVLGLDPRFPVTVGGNALKFPWTGGVNSPIFNQIDLDGDGDLDLFLFDRVGGRISTFLNDGIAQQSSYTYAPQFQPMLPEIHDWVRTVDFDCDGDLDIFTYTNTAIGVFRNDFTSSGGLSFTLVSSQLTSLYDTISASIYVTQVNLPAFVDVDGDSDLDIITFTSSGNFLEYHKNYSFDSTGVCGGLTFCIEPDCWGKFKLSGLSNVASLNEDCATINRNQHLHAGSVLAAFDQGCDGDIDLLNGDILGENMLFLENGGTADSALITAQDSAFPSYDVPVDMQNLPGPHYLDIDNDGSKDLVITPFATVGEDFENVHLYQNIGSNCNNQFQRVNKRFLVKDMVDVGTAANVALVDVDADGLLDIITGNDLYYNPNPTLSVSRLAYFRNTGTATAPAFTLISDNWLNTSSLQQLGFFPAFGDIDNDGDADMILGNADGKLLYYRNTAGAGNPLNLILNQVNYQGIDIGNNSAPQIVDVDRDGLKDLLIGERAGNLNYYRNTGSASAPVFTLITNTFGQLTVLQQGSIAGYSVPQLMDSAGTYILFSGSDRGTVFRYDNIDGNLSGAFTLTDSVYENIAELKRVTIAFADIDADGKRDLLTGCNAGGMRWYTNYATSALATVAAPAFNVFPNPAAGQCTLQFMTPSTDGRILRVFDIRGVELYRTTLYQKHASIELPFAAGIYLLQVSEGKSSFIQKIILQP
jgi:hypothetical protein